MVSFSPGQSASGERSNSQSKLGISQAMLKWTIICAVLAAIFGVLGFTGIAAGFAAIAKILFAMFLIAVLVTLLLGVTVFKSVT